MRIHRIFRRAHPNRDRDPGPIYRWMLLITALFLGGCTATVELAGDPPDDARPVFLLDHGFHCGLVMARADGSLVRYVYGEWRWYAKQETGIGRVFPTLLRTTTATLGRKQLSGPPAETNIRNRIPVVIKKVYQLSADSARVDALIEKLDRLFEDHHDTLLYNAAYDMEFVKHPQPYSLGNNSNHMAREWLRELGFTIRGNPAFGYWRVNRPASDP